VVGAHAAQVLAPLQPDWDNLDAQRKQKWRGIAQRYPQMKPDEQARIHEQMRGWAQLSPDERRAAREQYKSINKLPPDQRADVKQKWEQYQSLPPEQKRELASRPPSGGKIAAPANPPPGAKPSTSSSTGSR